MSIEGGISLRFLLSFIFIGFLGLAGIYVAIGWIKLIALFMMIYLWFENYMNYRWQNENQKIFKLRNH